MTTDEHAIRAILQQFEAAWNADDSAGIARADHFEALCLVRVDQKVVSHPELLEGSGVSLAYRPMKISRFPVWRT